MSPSHLPDPDGDPDHFVAWVLRTTSPQGFDVLAARATNGRMDWPTLLRAAGTPAIAGPVDPAGLARAGYAAILSTLPEGEQLGLALIDHAVQQGGQPSTAVLACYAQALLRAGRASEALEVTRRHALPSGVDWAIRVDAVHPSVGGDTATWQHLFNEPFREHDLQQVQLASTDGTEPAPAFAALSVPGVEPVSDDAMVSVVMSAFQPDDDLLMAVRSVLAQSWQNLELLIVDDATPDGYQHLFDAVTDLDPRVRVLRASQNRGTYSARNLALQHANGQFLTFHDSDDWFHPSRLEMQVRALREDPHRLGVRVGSVRAHPDLRMTYLGYAPERISASSFMMRLPEAAQLTGQFDSVRKSADMELPLRLRALRKDSVLDLPAAAPVGVYQLRGSSLSRADVRPGWTRWHRIAYRDFYGHWHRKIREGSAPGRLEPGALRPFPMPDVKWSAVPVADAAAPVVADLVVISDFRRAQPAQPRLLDLIKAVSTTGLRVAISNLEAHLPLSARRTPARREFSELLRSHRQIRLVHPEMDVHATRLLVANPAVFDLDWQFSGDWQIGSVAVIADSEQLDPSAEPTFDADRVQQNLAAVGGAVSWVSGLLDVVPPGPVAPSRARRERPVIGHHLTAAEDGWPADAAVVQQVFPADGSVDVLFQHNPAPALAHLEMPGKPQGWRSWNSAGGAEPLLQQLDYFVCLSEHPALPLAAEQAMAAGCVAVVHPRWRERLGDGALYVEPHDVAALVTSLHTDDHRRREQLDRGRQHLQRRAASVAANVMASRGSP